MSAETVDLTLIRYRHLDRKVSDLMDKVDTLTGLVQSLDGHLTQLHADRHRHEVDLGALRADVVRINRRLELNDE
ncbi:MAG: hypothetical protein B7Y02_02120 [Rhodobacterales bacterium 17-64-5]|nr:MAG: hypothetical protein B7Z31_03595 [Rhodobacterales bacterium 12-65-15]OZA17908.1 MAG: hypothetical protein B7Y02_02120 [Rhodobacterales bacterium 17-64-5]